MTRTVVASATREIVIGFDQPFCVIGERINPTGRKKLAAEMMEGNFETVKKDALEQVAAGATMLDVNAGVTAVDPNATEPALLVKTLEMVQELVSVPLSIDSSVTAAIEAALKVAKGRPLVNSVTGEEEKLEAILPLIKKYDVPVVAISNDETGISEDPDVRFAVARKIVERAADYGIPASDISVLTVGIAAPLLVLPLLLLWCQRELTPDELAAVMLRVVAFGCRNQNQARTERKWGILR